MRVGKLQDCTCGPWRRFWSGRIWGYPDGMSDPWIPRCRHCWGLRR